MFLLKSGVLVRQVEADAAVVGAEAVIIEAEEEGVVGEGATAGAVGEVAFRALLAVFLSDE